MLPQMRQQAMAAFRAGRLSEALHLCQQILALAPKQPDILALAGAIMMRLGNAEEAASCYEKAVAAKRDFAEAHYNLGNALMQLGRAAPAVEAYRRAAKHRPELVAIHNNLGNALHSLGRSEEAAQAYRRAGTLAPTAADPQRNLGMALQAMGRLDEAAAAYRRAIELKPDWSQAYSSLANLLIDRSEHQAVIEVCDRWLAACPSTIEAIGLKSVALHQIGDGEGARYLVDLARFVRVIQFDAPPEGCGSMSAFNAALAEQALNHPTLALPPKEDPHYHCPTLRITGQFLGEAKGAVAALERMMRQAVTDYLADLAREGAGHPFTAQPPRRWDLTSWATVLDRQGNLLPHIHYDGYVSGVYYPLLPGIVGASDRDQAGWFELGRLPDRFGRQAASEIRAIQPREGMMILFPSYFYHRTVPFEAGEIRISIAFDAMPLD